MNRVVQVVIGAVVAVWLLSGSMFQVHETELAIKFRLREIVRSDYEPGLHFMVPLINEAQTFDRRVQTRNYPAEQFLTSEGKILNVDFFVKWRISDVAQYYLATGGDDMRVCLWDAAGMKTVDILPDFNDKIHLVAFSPDNSQLLFVAAANEAFEGYFNDKIFLVPVAGGPARIVSPADATYEVSNAAWSRDGRSVFFTANIAFANRFSSIARAAWKSPGASPINSACPRGYFLALAIDCFFVPISCPQMATTYWARSCSSHSRTSASCGVAGRVRTR